MSQFYHGIQLPDHIGLNSRIETLISNTLFGDKDGQRMTDEEFDIEITTMLNAFSKPSKFTLRRDVIRTAFALASARHSRNYDYSVSVQDTMLEEAEDNHRAAVRALQECEG